MGNETSKGHHGQGHGKTTPKAAKAESKIPRFQSKSNEPIEKYYDVSPQVLGACAAPPSLPCPALPLPLPFHFLFPLLSNYFVLAYFFCF